MARCSRLVIIIFLCEEKFLRRQIVFEIFIVWSVPKIFVEKIDTNCWFKLKNTLTLGNELFMKVSMAQCSLFFSEKLVLRHVLVGRFLGPCLLYVEKMLPFNCVCSLKMGLLKLPSLILTDRKQYFLIQRQNTLPINKYSVSQFPVKCPTEKC